jgi:hypothetical protein
MAMAQTSSSPKCCFGDFCNNTMKPLFTRYLRGAVLGMMLLLSGMAGMVCFSYDADGDDSTPPVTVEFNGVVPSKKGIQISSPRSSAVAQYVGNVQPASTELLASVNYLSIPAMDMDKGSPQLVVPLRR